MIIDHGSVDHQKNLHALWDYVRPGGFYVMEFPIDTLPATSSRGLEYLHHPEQLDSITTQILQTNFPFFVDTSIGRLEWGVQIANSQHPHQRRKLCAGMVDWIWSGLSGKCDLVTEGSNKSGRRLLETEIKSSEIFGKNPAASFCIVIRKRLGSPPPIKNIGGRARVPFMETTELKE